MGVLIHNEMVSEDHDHIATGRRSLGGSFLWSMQAAAPCPKLSETREPILRLFGWGPDRGPYCKRFIISLWPWPAVIRATMAETHPCLAPQPQVGTTGTQYVVLTLSRTEYCLRRWAINEADPVHTLQHVRCKVSLQSRPRAA